MFELTPTGWAQRAKLAPTDGRPGAVFGNAVAIEGTRALIGALGAVEADVETGGAYVFELTGGAWEEVARLTPDDGEADDEFGNTVALSGDTALIGAWRDDNANGEDAGAAYDFRRTSSGWVQEDTLTASDGDPGEQFGVGDIGVDGETAIVGTIWDEDPEDTKFGAAYIFERGADGWTQTAKLIAPDSRFWESFGESVHVDGDRALVADPGATDPAGPTQGGVAGGEVYIFERGDGDWSLSATLGAADRTEGYQFGTAATLQGDTAPGRRRSRRLQATRHRRRRQAWSMGNRRQRGPTRRPPPKRPGGQGPALVSLRHSPA